ncbi:MAG TPA: NAD(+) diphosphatase [Alphaproteobacteria bacterium]|nr:NAD(+) diphosphatase [Alphaproteobacteria bacterium]HAJ45146.1 NAD(+) diphosphatase [Alphaproteobacteria bacterium]
MAQPRSRNPNTFANSPLDRASHRRVDAAWLKARLEDDRSLFLPLWRLMPFISGTGAARQAGWMRMGLAETLIKDETAIFLGIANDSAHFAVDLGQGGSDPAQTMPLQGLGAFEDLRSVAGTIDAGDAAILAQAKSLIDWHQRHRFCANCGARTAMADAGYKRFCERCETEHFPRTDPVVIMLAIHGNRCLLGRQPKWPQGFYSALAGFVEPGETIEEAVARELFEESAIKAGLVQYHSTQPWPYPSSLMIGCFAEALSTDIQVDTTELEEARWFTKEELRDALAGQGPIRCPPPLAIAHQLIKTWIEFTG